ncbi:MAG: energy transducer TonB [Rhodocyclaceae bacterium]
MFSTALLPADRRLILALAASFALHAVAVIGLHWLGFAKPAKRATPAALQARLLPPSQMPPLQPPRPSEPVLKNTLPPALAEQVPATSPDNPLRESDQGQKRSKQSAEAAMRRKLAEQVFYPPEAVAQGTEGEVRLLVALDKSGNVVQAKVVVSSGKEVLDKAAVAAAYRIGRIPDAGVMDLILPVIFKLE